MFSDGTFVYILFLFWSSCGDSAITGTLSTTQHNYSGLLMTEDCMDWADSYVSEERLQSARLNEGSPASKIYGIEII